MPHPSNWPLFIACLFLGGVPISLRAQKTTVFDTHTAVKPLEFLNQGQTAGSLTFRFQDSRGFIWGADEFYRLMRFDGNLIEIFENDLADSTTASPGKLMNVDCSFFEDSEGKIWIAYSPTGGYVDCYDPATAKFRQFRPQLVKARGSELSENARAVYEDHLGDIWMAAEKHLFRYDKSKNAILCFKMPNWVTLVFEDNDHNLWAHILFGNLVRINRDSGTIEERVGYPSNFKPSLDNNWNPRNNDYHHQLKGTDVHLLVVRGRFYEFDAGKRSITALHQAPLADEALIFSFSAKDDLILLATYAGLFLQYHLESKTFSQSPLFQLSQGEKYQEYSLPWHLFQSSEGIIWANVYQSGKKWIKNIQFFPSKLAFSIVTVPEEIKKVNFTVALGDYCLVFNGEPYFFTHPWLTPINPENPNSKKINLSVPGIQDPWQWTYHFETAPNGHLWQVTTPVYNSPNLIIREYDETGNVLNHYTRTKENNEGYPGGYVTDIGFDQNGKLWLSIGYGGVCQFNPEDRSFTDFSSGLGSKNPFIIDLLLDSQDDVWAAGGFGVKKLNRQDSVWKDVTQGKLPENIHARGLYEDLDGRIWFCTNNNVFKIDKQGNLKEYGRKEGFSGIGYYLFEDFFQQLWAASEAKVFLYDKGGDRFLAFGQEEGIGSQFFGTPYIIEKDSTIVIAGRLNDVHKVFPKKINLESRLPPLYFTDLQLFNEKVKTSPNGILQKSLDFMDEIQLKYEQNDFTIQYTAPEYAHPDELEFIVRMQGFNDDWQNLGNKREVRYTNLSPGEYIFQVKLRNHLGLESETPRSLIFTVLPPWYQTWWACGLWIALIAGSLYWLYQFQLNRKLAEAEARRLKELDDAKNVLYTNITHEFRTPLTVILGMIDQMKADPKNWFSEGASLIRRNGKLLLNLVNQMLDLSKLESGNMPLHLVQGDVVSYFKYLSESFHSYADSKDIRLHFRSDFPELVMDHDPEKLQNIISNLLSNAIKFTPAGGDVYLDLRRTGDEKNGKEPTELLLQVSDNGPGISKEHLPYIFDRFYQADSTHTRRGEGTGIGLALTRELVQVLGGSIQVESELGKGTQFRIWLPVKREAETASGNSAQATTNVLSETVITAPSETQSPPLPEQNDRDTVLLVEDNHDVLTYLSSILSTRYQVVTASDGQAGIDTAQNIIPDLIVSDVMMPEKDGFELCEALKTDERTSHIPIVLLTAKADQRSKIEGLSHRADAYLTKPFHQEELLVRLEKLIELRKSLQQHFQQQGALRGVLTQKSTSREDAFLKRVIEIIEAEMADENFGMPQLCKALRLTRTTLFRKLKALTGKSASRLIRTIRLEKAKELLEQGDQTVSEVCYAVGFNNAGYFSTIFKEEFGIAPSEVRR